jgi:hypothetical protein
VAVAVARAQREVRSLSQLTPAREVRLAELAQSLSPMM